jgi:hypothetical protein
MSDRPVFALFRHPDGSWYRLWITQTAPKTPRGHPWHVHATYDKGGGTAPVAGTDWYAQPYGMANWDFDSREEALAAFRERAAERLGHGYEVREGAVPESPTAKAVAPARPAR